MAHGPSHFLKRTFMEIHGGSRKSGWGHFHGNYGELWRTTDPFCLGQPGNGRGRARTEHNGTKCSVVFRVRTVFQEHSSLRCLPPRQAAASRGPHRRPPPAVPRSAAHRPRRPGLAGQQCSRPAGGAFRLCLPPPALWSGIVGSQSRGANVPRIKSQRFSPLDFAGLPGRAGPGRAARGCMARLGSQEPTTTQNLVICEHLETHTSRAGEFGAHHQPPAIEIFRDCTTFPANLSILPAWYSYACLPIYRWVDFESGHCLRNCGVHWLAI